MRMMEQDEFIGPVNLENPHEISNLELAEILIKATGSSSVIEYLPIGPDDPVKRRPDITLAISKLNW